jgi:ABC-type glycerol-3-phosphate transport system permease component
MQAPGNKKRTMTYGIIRKRDKGFFAVSRIAMALGIIGILFPILYILSLSLRTNETVYSAYAYLIPKAATLKNYVNALNYARVNLNVSFMEMFRNSLIASISSILIAIILSSLAAFSFSNFLFKGKELIFTLMIGSFIIPSQVLLIPLFFMLKTVGLIDTYLAIIIPYIAILIPIAILILRSFFEEIPREMKESARIDGASDMNIFLRIILPMSKPALASCAILLFLETWNEFIFALVFLQNPKLQTIPVAIAKIAGGKFLLPIGTYSASIMITVIPIIVVFVAFQKWFIAGITMGALKG